MNIHNNKDDNINNYLFYLERNVSKNIIISKNANKIDEIKTVLKVDNYEDLLKYYYNVKQLKQIAKEYKLKQTGNKSQLISRIYTHLHLSKIIIKIQKIFRGHIQRKYVNSHGPGFKNRSLCVNNFDFLSMDELTKIENKQFYSFKDEDGFIYGFDILSLYNLINKSNGVVKNPFNQQPLSPIVINKFKTLLRLSKLLKIKVSTKLSDITTEVSYEKSVELRALTLFQNIDALGNYTNVQWFLTLNKNQLITYVKELMDIWFYRANISEATQREICYPTGDPFHRLPEPEEVEAMDNLNDIRKIILYIMEKLVNSGINNENKCLGAYYVLSALTLVNYDAATSLYWLYEAAYHT
jgi:hypothetical protein